MSVRRFLFLTLLNLPLLMGSSVFAQSAADAEADYLKRKVTQTQDGLTVSVSGLSNKEAGKLFDANLAGEQILAVWLEVENKEPSASYYFFERHIDPHYYTPAEAAYATRNRFSNGVKKFLPPVLHFLALPLSPLEHLFTHIAHHKRENAFEANAFKYGWILPGETRKGFIFLPYEVGLKELLIDFEGYQEGVGFDNSTKILKKFDFMIEVPGIHPDFMKKEFDSYYPAGTIVALKDQAELIRYAEELPCCTTNKKGTRTGDPLNLIVIGEEHEVLTSFATANWDETETIYFGSVLKTIGSFSFKKNYRYSPVSPLYYLGRSQDIAFQKARKTINQRMHARLWYAAASYQGKPVWVGTVSRDIGVRFTRKTWNLMTHKIDPDINEAMLYTLNDLTDAQQIESYGVVKKGIPASTPKSPGRNLTGDPYFTDGTRVILDLSHFRNEDAPVRIKYSARDAAA